MTTRFARMAASVFAPLTLLAASACSEVGDTSSGDMSTQEKTSQTLASVLGDQSDLSILVSAWNTAGLSPVLDGQAAYTVLAPTDAAFELLGERSEWLLAKEQQPILVALLRDHTVPGSLTPEAIRASIKTKGGPVTMTTFGEGVVTFSLEKDTLVATGSDGSEATVSGGATVASNGVVIPVSGLLHEVSQVQADGPQAQ